MLSVSPAAMPNVERLMKQDLLYPYEPSHRIENPETSLSLALAPKLNHTLQSFSDYLLPSNHAHSSYDNLHPDPKHSCPT